jgi:ketosteroid isomerase-like protein
MTPAEFIREYESSTRTGGDERTLSLISDDAIYWFCDETSHVGIEAIEKAIRRNVDAIKDETYKISDATWIAETDDVAVCVYRFDWSGIVQGEPTSGFGRGTSVLECRDSRWLVVHEHLSKGLPS